MTVDFKFKNGQKVKCIITGFTGIIDCSALWINGCVRYSVQPRCEKGKVDRPDSIWMDEEQVELISKGISKQIKPTRTGGPSSVLGST